MASRVKVFFDGGCRPNPGAIEVAVVTGGQATVLRDLGHGSRADAEWLALIHALEIGQGLGRDFILIGDAADVVAQASGTMKCRGDGARHLERFHAMAGKDAPRIRHINRTQNLAGIALARLHVR